MVDRSTIILNTESKITKLKQPNISILMNPESSSFQKTMMLTPWKESYDQPRKHIQKQRHYFANTGPSSQGFGFSSSHIWM